MTIEKIAVPSNKPGGLDSIMSGHFGHCDLFTILTIQDNQIIAVNTVNNVVHVPGGCLAPVALLAEKGVNSIVVAGMGKRPLAGFKDVGINVFWTDRKEATTIEDIVGDLRNNKRQPMDLTQVCQGGGNCHNH